MGLVSEMSVRPLRGDAGPRPLLTFDHVSLRFGPRHPLALSDLHVDIPEGKFVAVIGPSGCGKSTLLNLAMGLVKPTQGSVLFRGNPVGPVNTEAAYVTQDANLLPWLTVEGNIDLGLKLRGVAKEHRAERVAAWIKRVGLSGFEHHFPRELSGGMQKRCAIARALIYDPTIVLMDEPFGPLDAVTRLRMQIDLLHLWEADARTVVFVTHDLNEAVSLADEVVVVSKGPGRVRGVIPVPIARPRNVVEIGRAHV